MRIGKIYHFRTRSGAELFLAKLPKQIRRHWALTGLVVTYWETRRK